MSVTIVKVGPDPFGRGERTVFYRDSSVNDGKEVFYLWACHWKQSYPDIPIPKDGFDITPPLPPPRPPSVPWVFAGGSEDPDRFERTTGLITIYHRK